MKNIIAAFIFFTRLPLWRLKALNVSAGYFREVINYWAVAGWLTGGLMTGVLWLSAQVFPYSVAVVLALMSRLLLTGALHEDGLADFLDGFGGGRTREKILDMMKDSHIGAYGVIGLIVYFLLFHSLLSNLPLPVACTGILIADPVCKLISSLVVVFLPYARTAETSKSGAVYKKMTLKALILSCLFGLLPLLLIPNIKWLIALLFPVSVFSCLVYLMKRKLNGYTGDCCGALFLLCELSFFMGLMICFKFFPG
jgi:adenosylcobinamide-GDP ribazoletransferase